MAVLAVILLRINSGMPCKRHAGLYIVHSTIGDSSHALNFDLNFVIWDVGVLAGINFMVLAGIGLMVLPTKN